MYAKARWKDLVDDYEAAISARQNVCRTIEEDAIGHRTPQTAVVPSFRVATWSKRKGWQKVRRPISPKKDQRTPPEELKPPLLCVSVQTVPQTVQPCEDRKDREAVRDGRPQWRPLARLLALSRDTLPMLYAYLSLRNICVASGVCRMWYRAACSPRYLSRLDCWPQIGAASAEGGLSPPLTAASAWTSTLIERNRMLSSAGGAPGDDAPNGEWARIYSRFGRLFTLDQRHLDEQRRNRQSRFGKTTPLNRPPTVRTAITLPVFCQSPPFVRLWLEPIRQSADEKTAKESTDDEKRATGGEAPVRRKRRAWLLVLHVADRRASVYCVPDIDRLGSTELVGTLPAFWPRPMMDGTGAEAMYALCAASSASGAERRLLALPVDRDDIRRKQAPAKIAVHQITLTGLKLGCVVSLPSIEMAVRCFQFRLVAREGSAAVALLCAGCDTGEILVWDAYSGALRHHMYGPPKVMQTKIWRAAQRAKPCRYLYHFGHPETDGANTRSPGSECMGVRVTVRLHESAPADAIKSGQSSFYLHKDVTANVRRMCAQAGWGGAKFTDAIRSISKVKPWVDETVTEWAVVDLATARSYTLSMPELCDRVLDVAVLSVPSSGTGGRRLPLLTTPGRNAGTEDVLLVRTPGDRAFIRNLRHHLPEQTDQILLWNNVKSGRPRRSKEEREGEPRRQWMTVDPVLGLWCMACGGDHRGGSSRESSYPSAAVAVHVPSMYVWSSPFGDAQRSAFPVSPLQGPAFTADRVFTYHFGGGHLSVRPMGLDSLEIHGIKTALTHRSFAPAVTWKTVAQHPTPVNDDLPDEHHTRVIGYAKPETPKTAIVDPTRIWTYAACDRLLLISLSSGALQLIDTAGHLPCVPSGTHGKGCKWRIGDAVTVSHIGSDDDVYFCGAVEGMTSGNLHIRGSHLLEMQPASKTDLKRLQHNLQSVDSETEDRVRNMHPGSDTPIVDYATKRAKQRWKTCYEPYFGRFPADACRLTVAEYDPCVQSAGRPPTNVRVGATIGLTLHGFGIPATLREVRISPEIASKHGWPNNKELKTAWTESVWVRQVLGEFLLLYSPTLKKTFALHHHDPALHYAVR